MSAASDSIEAAAETIRRDLQARRPAADEAEAEFITCVAEVAAWGLGWTKAVLEDGADPKLMEHSRDALQRLQLGLNTLGARRCRFTLAAAAMARMSEIIEAAQTLSGPEATA